MRLLVLTLTLVNAGLLQAQAGGTVAGVVTDSIGNPIVQADVVLRPTRQRARTDSAGAFSIGGVANGSYSVSARKIGYSPDLYDVKISSSGTVRVKLILALNPLDTVRVTATRECPLFSLSGFFCATLPLHSALSATNNPPLFNLGNPNRSARG